MADTKVYAGKEGIQKLWRRIKAEIGKFTAFEKKPAAPDGTPDIPVADRKTNIIYLVEEYGSTPPDMCKEWIWTLPEEGEGEWVCIGDTSVDLSKYVSTRPETFSAEEQAVARGNIGAASGDSLDAEVSRATAKEAELSGAISTETTRATDAEAALGNRITTETTRAEGVETTLSDEIANRYTKTETNTALFAKQDKPSSSTEGDIATFGSSHSTVDSGKSFLNSTGTWDGTSDALVPTAKTIQYKLDEKYTRPETGIPSEDFDFAVNASLGLADSALQGVKLADAETPITPDAGNIVTIPTFSTNSPGLVPSAKLTDAGKALRGDGTWGDAPFATAIAPEYDSTSPYPTVGTAVMYKGMRYVSNTSITTTEVWTPAHWDESDVESQFTAVEDALSDVNDILEDLSANPGMTDLGHKTEANLDNGALTIATGNSTTKLTLATVSTLTIISNIGVPNFAITIDNTNNSNNVTVSVVENDGSTALLNSTVAGTTITAGTFVQLTTVGDCWSMAEFDIPSI